MTTEKALQLIDRIRDEDCYTRDAFDALTMAMDALKEVEKHKATFEWCMDCKEYDKKNYCCHRWTKVIRDTVNDLKSQREGK